MNDLERLVERCNEMDITEQINWIGDPFLPVKARDELFLVNDFLKGLLHGPCAGVSYKDFVEYCQREARQLLGVKEQS